MKQGDSSSSAESKSTPVAAAAASPAAQNYKCRYCSRQFKTSHARYIHQSTHRMASEMRMKPYGGMVGAVLIYHIPSDDEDEVNGPSSDEPVAEAVPKKEAGSGQNPAKVSTVAKLAQTNFNAKGKEPAVTVTKPKVQAPPAKPKAKTSTAAGSSQPRAPTKKALVLGKPNQQQKQKPQQQQQRKQPEPEQPQTKDLLGEWSPMYVVRGEDEGSGSSLEDTPDLAEARVLDKTGDDLDLELNLGSMNNKNVDLELKLGF